ncbi:HlyD family secretion protein [Sporomusaceae bacterium BoRhaA]|uniref:HlyD family secretion protein n=1 Tax=Pelorhabdus rhamnosifermentans TaxID=2772457 RepID=UPI001C0622BD|nr:efflux RND transporter periplasmic adaptor subunit [Pelorhabdus rhamnosifermentans]MBU2703472.1 HlyD family secretion protein [Pelorhabdus rhamnosifermentans]
MNNNLQRGSLMKANFKVKKWMVVVLTVVILVAGGGYYAFHQRTTPTEQPVLPPVKASTKVVAEGKVVPAKYSVLSFSVSGIISEVLVAEGDKVEAGQVLVRLDSRELKAKSQSDLADLAKARASYSKTSAGLRPQEIMMKQAVMAQNRASSEEARANFERSQQLFEQGAVSKQQLDKDKTAYLKAQAELRQAEADLEMAKDGSRFEDIAMTAADVDVAQAKLHGTQESIFLTELRAPFSGTIASIDLKVGEFVSIDPAKRDENVEITDNDNIQLADLSKWQIKTTDLTEINIARIKEGAEVKITFDAIPGLEIPGKVTRIRPFGEKKRGDMTYAVFIEPLRMDDRMRWNMTASVSIEASDE